MKPPTKAEQATALEAAVEQLEALVSDIDLGALRQGLRGDVQRRLNRVVRALKIAPSVEGTTYRARSTRPANRKRP